jgi:glycerol-3-phosphate acyltransferase PlsX
MLKQIIETEIRARPLTMIGGLLVKSALKAVGKKMDYREFGGAALLGVDGVVIIGHGRSDAYAVRNAIRVARQAVQTDMVNAIKQGLEAQSVLPIEPLTSSTAPEGQPED